MRSAVVLADGVCLADGADPVRHTVEGVTPAVDDVVISCQCEQRERIDAALSAADYRLAADPVPGGGPVAGIRSGCRVARGAATFVTDCDEPLTPDGITALFEACEAGEVAVPRIEGDLRPLSAVYNTGAAVDAADVTLGMGSSAVTDMLDRLSVQVVADPASAE
jgi:molybdopterin-guanine dinucleotide biosynthesis protein A